jgi:hypothetical protein
MDQGFAPDASAFTLTGCSLADDVDFVAWASGELQVELNGDILPLESPLLSYTQPAMDGLRNEDGVLVASFTNYEVVNPFG